MPRFQEPYALYYVFVRLYVKPNEVAAKELDGEEIEEMARLYQKDSLAPP